LSFKKVIILVGTFHFEQDADLIRNKENEIEELVDYLLEFKPTKVALEWEKEQNAELNDEYKHSDVNRQIDEIQQIGFRLAGKLEHDKVYAINWAGQFTQEDMMNLNETIKSSYPVILNEMSSM
jgi:lysyl-tRNA synthetase class I